MLLQYFISCAVNVLPTGIVITYLGYGFRISLLPKLILGTFSYLPVLTFGGI